MKLDLFCFRDDAFDASGFHSRDTSILKLDVVTKVYAVIVHGLFFRMIQSDIPVVLLDSGLNGTSGLSSVDFNALAGDAVNTPCFQTEVILDRPKKNGDLARSETYGLYVKIQ
jgi:hypothetical protein